MNAKAKRAHSFHFITQDPDLDRLLKPNSTYRSPTDVVNDPKLPLSEKRAILASWASDACAVESQPAFRQPAELLHPVSFDDIMTALQELDRVQSATQLYAPNQSTERNRSPVC
jgi:hypothetical protein